MDGWAGRGIGTRCLLWSFWARDHRLLTPIRNPSDCDPSRNFWGWTRAHECKAGFTCWDPSLGARLANDAAGLPVSGSSGAMWKVKCQGRAGHINLYQLDKHGSWMTRGNMICHDRLHPTLRVTHVVLHLHCTVAFASHMTPPWTPSPASAIWAPQVPRMRTRGQEGLHARQCSSTSSRGLHAWRVHCRIWRPWPGLSGPHREKACAVCCLATPQRGLATARDPAASKRPEDVLCGQGDSAPPCMRPRALTHSSRGYCVDGHAVHFSRDPTCPAGNEGWDGTARGWTRGSARYRDIPGRWSLGRYKAIVAGWWTRRPRQRRPQEEEATSLMRSWWGQVICQSSYCSMSDDFKTLHGTCRSIPRVWREPVPRNQGGSARWSSDQLGPVLCVGLPWINRGYCYC